MEAFALEPQLIAVPPAPAAPGVRLDAAFGRVTALAARLFGVPVALVSLLDGQARRPRAAHGDPAEAERLHRELAPHLTRLDGKDEDGVIAVADLLDEFPNALPAPGDASAPRLRSLAVATLKTADGRRRGHLCVLDTQPRSLDEGQRRTLGELAAILDDELSLHAEAEARAHSAPRPDAAVLVFDPATDGDPSLLAARVRELSELNGSLLTELRGRGGEAMNQVRLEQLIEESSDSIGMATLDGKAYYLNAFGRRLMGLETMEEVKRTRLLDYNAREDRSFFLGTVVPTLMRVGRWEGDSRFRNFKTGAAIEVNWNLFLIKDPATGEPVGIASVARDVTSRKRAEAALRESEERFRHLVEQAGESFFVYELSGRLIDVNQEACESLGYPRPELLTKSVHDIDMEFDPVRGRDKWKQMVPGVAVTMTGVNRRKDGSTFPYEARMGAFRSGGQRLMLALVRDITDRVRAEEAVKNTQGLLEARVNERTAELGHANEELRAALRQNSLLAAAIESCQMGVLISDPGQPDAPAIFTNNAFTNITGYSRVESIGRNCRFLQGPGTDPAEISAIREAVAARRSYRGTLLNYRRDGSPFWNELTINPVFDETGGLVNLVGFQADVTAQVKAQEALRESERRFSRMTANVPGMVYQLLLRDDGTANFPYVSEGCREMFGQEPAEMEPDACTLLDMIHPDDIAGFLTSLDHSRDTRTAWAWEGRYIRKDGATHWLQGAARPEPRNNGTLWDGLLLDITERKHAEQEIRDRARQAAAISELGQRALGGADYAALSREAAQVVKRTLGVQLCNVVELLPDMTELVIRGSAGFREDLASMKLGTGEGSLAGFTIVQGAPQYSEDLRREKRFHVAPVLTAHQAVTAQSVLIHGKDQPLGALVAIDDKARQFLPEDINFMQAVANVLATAVDRSRDEQALRTSEARNAAILETALDCIVTLDHEDRIVEFNPAAEKTFGFSRVAALGRSFAELIRPASGAADLPGSGEGKGLLRLAGNAAAGDRPLLGQRVEMPACRSDGSQILVEVAVTRIPVEGVPLFTAYLRDITERKRTEVALGQAKVEAERANKAKSEFLSRMSHELRTPLNAILGFGQLLQMQKLTPAQNDRVGHIVNAGRHLLDLINEVLDIARIEAGRVELSLEPVRVSDLVGETLDLIRPLASQRQIRIHHPTDDHPLIQRHVMADRQRFKQVLLNLLSNAVKYNADGGSVRLDYTEGDAGRLRIGVTDTGAGISADKVSRLFVPFERLGAETSNVQGTGLGLALSKRLMEAMDGAIGLDSVPGQGTTFWVELPHAENQMDRRSRVALTGAPSHMETLEGTHKVLYIEDNLSNLTLIEHLLIEHTEIKLITAMQGGIGIDLARQHCPDLILLDLHLPDIPGWEVLARLRADEKTRDIPVIAVSADATPRQVERLMAAGAQDYLTKPLDIDRFHEMMRRVLVPKSSPASHSVAP